MVTTACGPSAKRLRGGEDARPLPTLMLATLPRCDPGSASACACAPMPGAVSWCDTLNYACPLYHHRRPKSLNQLDCPLCQTLTKRLTKSCGAAVLTSGTQLARWSVASGYGTLSAQESNVPPWRAPAGRPSG